MPQHRLTRSAALALALAALAAPAAGAQQNLSSPDAQDAAKGRGTSNSPQVIVVRLQPPSQPAPAGGLDWADAGIGAGGLLGLGLVGLGGGLVVMHRKRRAHAPAARV